MALSDMGLQYSSGIKDLVLVGEGDLARLPGAALQYPGHVCWLKDGFAAWKQFALDDPTPPAEGASQQADCPVSISVRRPFGRDRRCRATATQADQVQGTAQTQGRWLQLSDVAGLARGQPGPLPASSCPKLVCFSDRAQGMQRCMRSK